jgi:hypothetical protein
MKGIEVRFPVGRDECAARLYRPRAGDSQVPAVVLGTGLSVADQAPDRLPGALPQPATPRSRSTTGTSATAAGSHGS